MRKRIRQFNWSNTDLGDPEHWPNSLKTAMSIMLDCASPSYIAWGPRFLQIYNDAYIPIFGSAKHPEALGKAASESWHEIWDFVGTQFQRVTSSAQAIWKKNEKIMMWRNGYLEECFFTFSYSPLRDDEGAVKGVLVLPIETTSEVICNRRTETVRFLAEHLSRASNMADILFSFEHTIAKYQDDLPFGLWYAKREERNGLELVAAAGIERGSTLAPQFIEHKDNGIYYKLGDINEPVTMECVATAPSECAYLFLPQIPIRHISIKPLCYTTYLRPDAYLIFGQNPLHTNDRAYINFLREIRTKVENAVRRIHRSELENYEREHQYQSVMAALPCMVWISDIKGNCVFLNKTWLDFTGRSLDDERGTGWIANVHPDDREALHQYRSLRSSQKKSRFEFRLRNASGKYRWLHNESIPHFNVNGDFTGHIGTCIDITERKQIEEEMVSSQKELSMLYAQLETIRNEERYALAREVHDQLGQTMSAAKIDIKLLEQELKLGNGKVSNRKILKELRSAGHTIDKAIQAVRNLATELRPPELEAQGVEAAIEWYARDFERRTRVMCSVTTPKSIDALNDITATALFRIFQEAMNNILRHAKATRVEITLKQRKNWIKLRIVDDGIGISLKHTHNTVSLGLKGMRERAKLAGGRLLVGPTKTSGTLVCVALPLKNTKAS